MIQTIIKRDGRCVLFDLEKIANAIFAAAQALGGEDYETAQKLAAQVADYLERDQQNPTPTVEQIQDAVEKILVETGHARTAKEFILYRAQRTRVRDMNTRLMKTLQDLTYKSAGENDIKRENANIDGDTAMGTMLKYGSEAAKQFYHMFVLNPAHSKAFCGSPTISPAMLPWPVSPSSPTRTTSTAARVSPTSTTAWPAGWPRPTGNGIWTIWPRRWNWRTTWRRPRRR